MLRRLARQSRDPDEIRRPAGAVPKGIASRVRSDQSYAELSAAGIVTSRGRYRSWRGKAKALELRSRALSGKTVEASKTRVTRPFWENLLNAGLNMMAKCGPLAPSAGEDTIEHIGREAAEYNTDKVIRDMVSGLHSSSVMTVKIPPERSYRWSTG